MAYLRREALPAIRNLEFRVFEGAVESAELEDRRTLHSHVEGKITERTAQESMYTLRAPQGNFVPGL